MRHNEQVGLECQQNSSKQSRGQYHGFPESFKTFQKNEDHGYRTYFQKEKTKEDIQTHSCDCVTLILQSNKLNEQSKWRLLSLMNIDVKSLMRLLDTSHPSQQHTKGSEWPHPGAEVTFVTS